MHSTRRQGDVARCAQKARAELTTEVASTVGPGARAGLPRCQGDVAASQHLTMGRHGLTRTHIDLACGSDEALLRDLTHRSDPHIRASPACEQACAGGIGIHAISGGHGRRRIEQQVTTDFERDIARHTQLAQGGQHGVCNGLALNGQVATGEDGCIAPHRHAPRKHSIAAREDAQLTHGNAVAAKAAARLAGLAVQALGQGVGPVLKGGHIGIERDLGHCGHLGFDLEGAKLGLVGEQVGDAARPVVMQRATLVRDGRVGALPVVLAHLKSFVGVVGQGPASAAVKGLRCHTLKGSQQLGI